MPDMLVHLTKIKDDVDLYRSLEARGIAIKRALAPDRLKILRFIEQNTEVHWPQESQESWFGECEAALSNSPPSCFLAVKDKAIIGFACYNATAKGYFGPTGVLTSEQKQGIGKALLLRSLRSMWEEGYGYAIIGWPARRAMGFYEKTAKATVIEDSSPGIYSRLVESEQ
jgi:GNAT superfamily N-acetyltransferase